METAMPFSRNRNPENGWPIQRSPFTVQTAKTTSTGARTAASHHGTPWALALAALAGGLGVVALGSGHAGVVAWVALVPLFVALDRAGSFRTLAVAIVYAVVLGVGGLGPWLSHAAAAYFGLGRAVATAYVAL